MYVSDSDNTWTQVYEPIGLYPLRHYYTPESSNNNVNCMVSERNEVKDCKGNTLTYNYYIDGNGLIGAILLYPDSSDPPEPVFNFISNDRKIRINYCYFTGFNSRNNNNIHS